MKLQSLKGFCLGKKVVNGGSYLSNLAYWQSKNRGGEIITRHEGKLLPGGQNIGNIGKVKL